MNYQEVYEKVKSELAVKHGVILDINDPVILASYLQMKITAEEVERINDKHAIEIKRIKSKIEDDQNNYSFKLKEIESLFKENIEKSLEIKLWIIIPSFIIACVLCLLIGKFLI